MYACKYVYTGACAVFMNFIFWFSCNIFWAADMNYAIKNYLWGFVNDIFGECAASGYKDIYGGYERERDKDREVSL